MKIGIECFFPKMKSSTIDYLEKSGIKVSKNPEIVLVLGGDGTLLYSEKLYPSIPKLHLRIYEYNENLIYEAFEKIKKNEYEINEFTKLEYNGKKCFKRVHNKKFITD